MTTAQTEARVRELIDLLGWDETTARFAMSIEDGERTGDVIELDAHGHEIPPTSST